MKMCEILGVNKSHQLKSSLTWDRGPEMAKHKKFTVATKLEFAVKAVIQVPG